MNNFAHLHVHTQYSILDGASSIYGLIGKAKKDGQTALAITDHGNMFGVKVFHKTAMKEGIKPIIGCEAYIAKGSMKNKDGQDDRSGDHLIILAKNPQGYHNLMKLVSYSYMDGYYYKPRMDKKLLRKYHEGLIVCSACLGGEIPQAIMAHNIKKAEEVALEFKEIFGDDFYLEIQRHKTGNPERDRDTYNHQVTTNKAILEIGAKYNIKVIATNDVHFVDKEDAEAHDILICLNTGKDLDDPSRMRYTGMEYLKTQQEMNELFSDIPESIINTQEIVNKIETYELNHKPIMPVFQLPEGFTDPNDYLRHITYEGANQRWAEITEEIRERLDFELDVMKRMGFPGYFLIVWDFLRAAREMGVAVGPGRGSAAGSAVAYCLRITDIDPIAYNLLFERFLNPDRISMPDIDIDFDEDGRELILDWVVNKYGQKRVANIITFGTMAAKMAIKDVARVLKLPLNEADQLTKYVPDKPGTTIKDAYEESAELREARDKGSDLVRKTLKFAGILEGSVRQTGVHACGIIIGRDDLEENIPLSIAKDSKLYVVQYDGKHVEDIGLLKMDFLGLKTLSIIKDCISNIKYSKNIDVDIDSIPITDKKTYELYSKGETTALFQFESDGMKKYLKALQPNRFDDLIAMNALYRPGPMDYIPSFVNRKHGKEPIKYDLPQMEEYLKDTYGITVYQEQVMLLSQKLAGFTKGQADSLRKAMGKKIKAMMDELKGKFIEGGEKNGHPKATLEKIWVDWEAFAQYAFNKSHSTCYAYVSYQTAFLKAHYPAEFMAAVLSRNLSDIKKITFFMEECKRMGLEVLGPDVNESITGFTVNKKGAIRFGMAAIKGVGEAAVNNIIAEREKNGAYKDIFDFVERVNLSAINKRTFEGLVLAGAFDGFGKIKREEYFGNIDAETNYIEALIRYGNRMQSENGTNQASLFGATASTMVKKPEPPKTESWSELARLNKEKELIGIYLSAHPLDNFRIHIESYCNTSLSDLRDMKALNGREIKVAGIVTSCEHKTTKTGNPFGSVTIEDFTDSYKITLFSKDYLNFKQYFTAGYGLVIRGKIGQRFGNPEELELKVSSMDLLNDMKDKMINSLAIKISLDKISDELISDIQAIAEDNKGPVGLKFLIFDPETKIWVQMQSKSHKVDVNKTLIASLENLGEVEYKIF